MTHSSKVIVALALAVVPIGIAPAAAAPAAPSTVPGEIVVRYRPGQSAERRQQARAAGHAHLRRALRLPRTELLRVEPGEETSSALAALQDDPAVEFAEPNFLRPTTASPNDPTFNLQWYLHNTGQTVRGIAGTPDADIDAPEAWDLQTGSASVVVAVADTGLDVTHPDLAGRLWTNTGETAANGIDDDGNGHVDDVHGWNFFGDRADIYDYGSHGTKVAGTIGAQGNNGEGVTGVAWNSRLMPLKVCEGLGCSSAAAADAYLYARDEGAQIVNGSFAGPFASMVEKSAIDASPGVLFVFGSGNDALDVDTESPRYPCAYTSANIVCVAATNQLDNLAAFSNTGLTSVDLAAPGTNGQTTWPAYLEVYNDDFEGTRLWDYSDGAGTAGGWERTTETAVSGVNSITDSEGVNYADGADASTTLASPVSLFRQQRCAVDAVINQQVGGAAGTELHVATSVGGPYTMVSTAGGSTGGWQRWNVPLPGVDGQPQVFFRLRFRSVPGSVGDGVHVDDFVVRCKGTGTTYGTFSGTSMATPVVAGVAALVKAHNSSATVAQLKNALLRSVDLTVPGGATALASGGRVNARSAIAIPGDGGLPTSFNLVAPAGGATTRSNGTFSWQASSDPESGLRKYQLLVDNAVVKDDIAPGATSTSLTTGQISGGSHTWFVRAVDKAGNARNSAFSRTVFIDDTPPSTFTLSAPANATSTSTAPTFSWVAATDNSAIQKYQLLVDGSLAKDNISADSPGVSTSPPSLADGVHSWKVRAFDLAGNTRDSTDTRTFMLDTVAPAFFLLAEPADGAMTAQASPTFTWQPSSDSLSGLAGYQLFVDGAADRDVAPGTTSATPLAPLAEGSHVWFVRARDGVGNTTDTTTRTLVVDTSPLAVVAPPGLAPPPGITPSGGVGVAADVLRPRAKLTVPRSVSLATLLRRGVRVRCGSDEPGTCRVILDVAAATARRLGLRWTPRGARIAATVRVALGTKSIALRAAGTRRFAVKLLAAVRRALGSAAGRRRAAGLRIRVSARVADTAGNVTKVERRLRVRGPARHR